MEKLSFKDFLEAKEAGLPPPPPGDPFLYLRQLDAAFRALAASSWYQSQEMRDYIAGRLPPRNRGK